MTRLYILYAPAPMNPPVDAHDSAQLGEPIRSGVTTHAEPPAHYPTKHAGDCTIWSAMINGSPTDGICTCGFGFALAHSPACDWSHMFSDERHAAMQAGASARQLSDREPFTLEPWAAAAREILDMH